MRQIRLEPLTAEAFAPFGQVLQAPPVGERVNLIEELENRRPAARAQLTLISVPPRPLPLEIVEMERHAHSSQAILPLEVGRWAVIVAPEADHGGPDAERVRAFWCPTVVASTIALTPGIIPSWRWGAKAGSPPSSGSTVARRTRSSADYPGRFFWKGPRHSCRMARRPALARRPDCSRSRQELSKICGVDALPELLTLFQGRA